MRSPPAPKAPVFGEYQVRLYSTFPAILMAECGLRPIRFCQFFGAEASAYVTGQQANFGLTRRREISIHCTGYNYGEGSKESSVFFLWAKESFSL